MKKFLLVVTVVLLFAAAVSAAPVQRLFVIQQPLLSFPAIVKTGDSFVIKLKLPAGSSLGGAYLQPAESPEKQIELSVKTGSADGGMLEFTATPPPDTPPALYDLTVRDSNDDWDRQPDAVKVISDFKSEYDFVHITDIHFNVDEVKGKDMALIRRKILKEIRDLNPEFILMTGDLNCNPDNYDKDYVFGYEELLRWVKSPVFIVPGNHELYSRRGDGAEVKGAEYWNAAYGLQYQSFDYGNIHFMGINDFDWPDEWRFEDHPVAAAANVSDKPAIGDVQWNWIKSDLEAAQKGGKKCIAYAHIPLDALEGGKSYKTPSGDFVVPGPNNRAFSSLLSKSGCTHIFVGHLHYDGVMRIGAVTEVLTRGAGQNVGHKQKGRNWGYRVVHVKDGKIAGMQVREVGFEDLN